MMTEKTNYNVKTESPVNTKFKSVLPGPVIPGNFRSQDITKQLHQFFNVSRYSDQLTTLYKTLDTGIDNNTGPKVLIVDDDSTMLRFYHRLLDKHGYRVCEAYDGQQAIDLVSKFIPDVIVMDAIMPNLGGLDCTRQIKSNPDTGDIPIIMISASTGAKDIIAGLEAGVDEYVAKPIQAREFILRVRSMARLHLSRNELAMSNQVRSEQARILSLLLDLSQTLAVLHDLDETLERILLMTSELTGSRQISIYLPDNNDKCSLYLAKATGVDENLIHTIPLPNITSVINDVYTTGNPLIFNTSEDVSRYNKKCKTEYIMNIPMICFPLYTAENIIGVINITDRYGHRHYQSFEIETIDLLTNIAATAIQDIHARQICDAAHDSIVHALAKLAEFRDDDTGSHLDRVTHYCLTLARYLQSKSKYQDIINKEFMYNMKRAVPLHDIGKVAIPDAILLKPGKLSDEEMNIMRTHAEIGWKTICSVKARVQNGAIFLQMAEDITYAHHERFDGKGYPRGLSGTNIPLAARITSLADVYDALTTDRVYRKAMSHEATKQIIVEGKATQFDPEIVDTFLACEAEFIALATELADKPVESEKMPSYDTTNPNLTSYAA